MMDGTSIFLTVFVIGVGFITLWLVADTSRRLTRQTHQKMAEAQAEMLRVMRRYDHTIQSLENEINDLKYDVTKLKKDHQTVISNLKEAAAIAEQNRMRQKIAANSI